MCNIRSDQLSLGFLSVNKNLLGLENSFFQYLFNKLLEINLNVKFITVHKYKKTKLIKKLLKKLIKYAFESLPKKKADQEKNQITFTCTSNIFLRLDL